MSVLRIPKKIKTFVYEGITFGLRNPITNEVLELTKRIAAYQRSAKKELKEDVESKIESYTVVQGDMSLLHEAQLYIAKTLTIDPETQEQIFTGSVKIEEQDNDFVLAAWNCYSEVEKKTYMYMELSDLLDKDWLVANAKLDADVVHKQIEEIRKTDKKKAQEISYLLNYRPLKVVADRPLETTEQTTTSNSEEISSV